MSSKYKISYHKFMKGGHTDFINTYPDYPDHLAQVRTADWPPQEGENITINNQNNKFKGSVVKNIWNNTASVVKLNNDDYVELSFKDETQYNNGKGYYLLLADHYWNYENNQDFGNDNKMKSNNLSPSSDNLSNIPKSNNYASNRVNTSNDLQVSDFSHIHNLSLEEKQKLFQNINPNAVLSNKESSVIPHEHVDVTQNPMYSPLLSKPKKDYFSEKEIDIILSNTGQAFSSLSPDKIELLNRKLKSFEVIDSKDIKSVVNKNVAVNNLITEPDDEINEGGKIKNWIEKILKTNIFTDLQIKIHSGYVYITRTGATITDNITKNLVPSLNYFKWQENKPIDYHTLKYVIFQNSFQKNIETNIVQKREAEDILSQEYVVALQPSTYYLLWTLKRLIMIWYGDTVVESNIRKVKVLINQFRADPNQDYNKKNGLLPQILIYPRYGSESARIIISRLEYYFSLYIDENTNPGYTDIQWKNSHPSYFIKKNAFMYFSNGSIDLKNYIKESFKSNSGFINDIFTKDYSELIESKKVMSV